MTIVLVALAGGLGALARTETSRLLASRRPRAPWGTRLVNTLGAAALAWLLLDAHTPDVLRIVGTGFLGGFTTFSSWMTDATHPHGRVEVVEVVVPFAAGLLAVVLVRAVAP